nr:RNA polymerase sigma factor [uncultured Dyadobacter sp.]
MKFLKLFQGKTREPVPESEKLSEYRRTGDLRLLGELYAPYMEMVFGVCYRYLRNEEESKDAVMQVFEKLITDLKIQEVTNFKSWLHSVARNHCLMKLRARRVFVTTDEMEELEGWTGVTDAAEQDDLFAEGRVDLLSGCMKKLPQAQRVAVELFYIQDKCYREIADTTGYDLNKVKSYIQNGKRNLKICVDGHGKN